MQGRSGVIYSLPMQKLRQRRNSFQTVPVLGNRYFFPCSFNYTVNWYSRAFPFLWNSSSPTSSPGLCWHHPLASLPCSCQPPWTWGLGKEHVCTRDYLSLSHGKTFHRMQVLFLLSAFCSNGEYFPVPRASCRVIHLSAAPWQMTFNKTTSNTHLQPVLNLCMWLHFYYLFSRNHFRWLTKKTEVSLRKVLFIQIIFRVFLVFGTPSISFREFWFQLICPICFAAGSCI